jgi:uncharacterized damage-inducible protein DinB
MKTMIERFRRWYDHERDSNAKCLGMLNSVPEERRSDPGFQKALDKMAHLVAARQRWLFRLGQWPEAPAIFPTGVLADLPASIAATETAWVTFLSTLDYARLAEPIEYNAADNKKYRWNLEGLLTQVNGHAWYHRGQIAMLVSQCGGKMVDTDYIFFDKPVEVK